MGKKRLGEGGLSFLALGGEPCFSTASLHGLKQVLAFLGHSVLICNMGLTIVLASLVCKRVKGLIPIKYSQGCLVRSECSVMHVNCYCNRTLC